MSKSLEQRIYEAFHANRGMKLSAVDVHNLLVDDAVDTRVTNAAAQEAGNAEVGYGRAWASKLNWTDFGKSLK